MAVVASIVAALAFAVAPAGAVPRVEHPLQKPVHAAPAPVRDEDSLPRWLVPGAALGVLAVAALAIRRP